MVVLLDGVTDLGPLPATRPGASRALEEQLDGWRRSRGIRDDVAPVALELAILMWTRLHGQVASS